MANNILSRVIQGDVLLISQLDSTSTSIFRVDQKFTLAEKTSNFHVHLCINTHHSPGLVYGSLALMFPVVSLGLPSPASFSAITLNSYSSSSTRSLQWYIGELRGALFWRTNLKTKQHTLSQLLSTTHHKTLVYPNNTYLFLDTIQSCSEVT